MRQTDLFSLNSIHGDEYYTYDYDVEKIAQRLRPGLTIWCPFDRDDSQFPKVLRQHGFKVVHTCTDFFTTDPPEGVNAIVSNPPFSRKKEVLQRCRELDMKFALILPILMINDGTPLDYGQQIMLFRKRMHFYHRDNGEKNKPRTNCFVLSNGLLQHDFDIVR